jgi:glycosyltransferase involved in cell wall biosynthesis
MKILCLIDSLGSGGAQRQLVSLAVGLKKRGHQIRFLVYHQDRDFFLSLLQAADIHCQVIPSCSYVRRALAVRKILRQDWQDVVLAFMEAPSLYAELASTPKQPWGLVVGERSADPEIKKAARSWLRQFHRLADAIVCNSHTNKLMLEALFPFLETKLCTVYNMVDFKLFLPIFDNANGFSRVREFRIVVVASYQEIKNMMNVAKAVLVLNNQQTQQIIVIDWFGAMPAGPAAFNEIERFVVENNLNDSFRLHAATQNIAHEFLCADVVGLFSFYEGLPNVVCEGMASGKPILLSNVCDASNLVKDGINGFLCDPTSPEDIAKKIQRLVDLSDFDRRQMGHESRKVAEQLFTEEVVVERYERILKSAANHASLPADCSWPAHVPESAVVTVDQWLKDA